MMPNTLEEHGLVSQRGELSGSPKETPDWIKRLCETLDLVQDQKIFKIMAGGRVESYYGHLIDTDEDAQSDAAHENLMASATVLSDAVCRALCSQLASAWDVAEEITETEPTFDAELHASEAKQRDQSSVIDEIAEDWTSDHLAHELLHPSAEDDWPRLRELILTAEDFEFSTKQSALLAPRLLDLAIQYRESNDTQDKAVVWSAIRTGASMLRPNEADRLLALLEPGHSIDTSLVALKMIGRIFEAQPPEKRDQHANLAGEVRGIAESLLNPHAIASSQIAATAQLAVYALAAMASNEVMEIVRAVRQIDVSWFIQQTAHELRELRSYWDERSSPVAPDVLELLERATQELRTT